jgi:hypothetical protein
MSLADPIDLTETVLSLERMVGESVSVRIEVLPNEDLEVLRVSGILGPHRTG